MYTEQELRDVLNQLNLVWVEAMEKELPTWQVVKIVEMVSEIGEKM